ncbi:MAG: zinc metallopeptidase [Coriobacteriales bacterium]|jgi:Zn-dependent membrane protease YugP|nr:zinc metallopeptidase [Coriobacteriales bacterium]
MSLGYLGLIAVTLILGLGTQAYIKHSYKKWDKVPITTGMTGAQAARRMLDENGLTHIAVQQVSGELSDHFDPRKNIVSLSEGVYSSRSVAATAVACHECGHAVQHARHYVPAVVRGVLVPAVNIASNAWVFVLMAGMILSMLNLIYLAIILYAAVIIFQVITLPVELNASRRAVAYVRGYGFLPENESKGAKTVLTAAALTYVAAALSSVLYLLYLLGMARR